MVNSLYRTEVQGECPWVSRDCSCLCGKCYQLTWLRKPQNCNCIAVSNARYLDVSDKIRTRRRNCRCNPDKRVRWSDWFCNGCLLFPDGDHNGSEDWRRQCNKDILEDLQARIEAELTSSDNSDFSDDVCDTSYCWTSSSTESTTLSHDDICS